uniref:COMMD8 helical N-terminal domain-containing protein n=1 Tax=Pundamilia nyererei TaxID=303518 RepID=A0A3B4EYA2_9CICH
MGQMIPKRWCVYQAQRVKARGWILCHRVVDSLCGREPPHRGDYSATWSLQEWLQLLDSLTALFRLAVVNNISDEVVRNSQAEVVLSVLRAREEEIRCALLDRTNSISSATLQDFDWQLKVTRYFSSDESIGLFLIVTTGELKFCINSSTDCIKYLLNSNKHVTGSVVMAFCSSCC